MVMVISERTQLTLSGVQREVDGATVVCTDLHPLPLLSIILLPLLSNVSTKIDNIWCQIVISDKCTSVTALYSAGVVNTEMNVITKIGVRTQGTSGTCHYVKIDLDNCSASLDGVYVNKSSIVSVGLGLLH